MAAAELESRKREIDARIHELDKKQQTLLEIRDSLVQEEEILLKRLSAAKAERENATGQMDSKTQKTMEVLDEMEGIKREITLLDRRYHENRLREKELDQKIDAAEKALFQSQSQFHSATNELEIGKEALARLDRRIEQSKMVRARSEASKRIQEK